MSIENPYLDDNFAINLKNSLPNDHPANEKPKLTVLQSFAFPILLWFFDGLRNRGQGRSQLMAYVLIELAMRGEQVYVNDLTTWPLNGKTERIRNHFVNQLMDIIDKEFKNHYFEYRKDQCVLIYKGRKPR
jgi:hypothetical protein